MSCALGDKVLHSGERGGKMLIRLGPCSKDISIFQTSILKTRALTWAMALEIQRRGRDKELHKIGKRQDSVAMGRRGEAA